MDNEGFKVEYLIIIDTSKSFCSNRRSFDNLLKTNSDLNINGSKLKYKDLQINYFVQTQRLEQSNERFFHLTLVCEDNSKIIVFEECLRVIRDIAYKINGFAPQVLWDDLGFFYAQKSYPIIYRIENLLRKLITKFMLTNVGVGWVKENVPDEVKKTLKGANKEESDDYLYKIDFIQLDKMLFEKFYRAPISNLIEKLGSIENLDELSLQELKEYVPKSNWERYFSELVECDEKYLSKNWKKLYEFRNKIAHSVSLNRSNYEEIKNISIKIEGIFQKAIESLDQIHVPTEDKEIIAEDLAINRSTSSNNFLQEYRQLELVINKLLPNPTQGSPNHINDSVKYLLAENLINSDLARQIKLIVKIRNLVVHSSNSIDESTLENAGKICDNVIERLLDISIDLFKEQMQSEESDNQNKKDNKQEGEERE
ncbi:HEPN domain-containing protein [Priestia megaterium]|uniref:HEPN domain-containing protein n=1 Tax=Priestia megaterium TaxID=1404 RepID=UPI0027A7DEE5|nr:HEPN domain-containing protein [Priestia megaterium]WDC90554.1 HEPN domain-containing protein [Priestia megaterium]